MPRKNDAYILPMKSFHYFLGTALLVFMAERALPAIAMDDCAAIRHNIAELEKYASQLRSNISMISTGGSPYDNPTYGGLLRTYEDEIARLRTASCSGSTGGGTPTSPAAAAVSPHQAQHDKLRGNAGNLLSSLSEDPDGGPEGGGSSGKKSAQQLQDEENERKAQLRAENDEKIKKVAQEGYPAKDASKNWAGTPCEFFTCPRDRKDKNGNVSGSGNIYSDGTIRQYGKYQYICTERRWQLYGVAGPLVKDAASYETSCQNSYGAPLQSVFFFEDE